ncbi:MAG TPA: hypothetical protein VKP68_14400 [Ramlibacter sp.]|nr:hypothetical protein [Ramlibacter sp.]
MNVSNDTKEDHGSNEPQRQEGVGDAHSGHGAASALARFKAQKQERQMLHDPEGTSGGLVQ